MVSPLSPPASPADILSTRFFAVTRDRLFAAFSQPDQLVHWWGPNGFTNTFEEFDLRVDGMWRFTMHAPDGKEYLNLNRFTEVLPSKRIVFQHLEPVHRFDMVLDFEDADGGTQLTWQMRFQTMEEAERVRAFILVANEENFDRLEAHLAAMPGNDEFVLRREFEVPRDLLFKAWTDASTLAQWWGPHTFTNAMCELDARPGGEYRITMRSPQGEDFPIRGTFLEVNEPSRIIFTMDCTEHPPAWHDVVKPGREPKETNPAGILWTTVTFQDLGPRTKLDLRVRFESASIRDTFVSMGMEDGWTESLEGLAALLSPKQKE